MDDTRDCSLYVSPRRSLSFYMRRTTVKCHTTIDSLWWKSLTQHKLDNLLLVAKRIEQRDRRTTYLFVTVAITFIMTSMNSPRTNLTMRRMRKIVEMDEDDEFAVVTSDMHHDVPEEVSTSYYEDDEDDLFHPRYDQEYFMTSREDDPAILVEFPPPKVSNGKIAPDEDEDHQMFLSTRVILSLSLLFLLMTAFLVMGDSTPKNTFTENLRTTSMQREDLLVNQERLLLELAKTRDMPMDRRQLLDHIDLLKQELEGVSKRLQDETSKRTEMELQLQHSKETLHEFSSELAHVERERHGDLSRMLRTLGEKLFGQDPRYVEFQMKVWTRKDDFEIVHFTVETAPTNIMPASVTIFLQQVDAGLWDDTSFYINAPHMLVAQPVSGDGATKRLPEMESRGLAHVPIPEYNDSYPHLSYTLGFGGDQRPGPFFYINKVDNTAGHKGQPCFAKVIIGHEAVDKIDAIGSPSNDYYIKPVEILSVRLLDRLEDAVGGEVYVNFMKKVSKGKEF